MRKFLNDTKGNFALIFALLAAIAVPMLGVGYDYTRIQSFKGKLQSVTDHAVRAAFVDASSVDQLKPAADRFISANIPNTLFESRRSLVDGNILFQVRGKFKTPLLGFFGNKEQWVYVSTQMPNEFINANHSAARRSYTEREIKRIEKKVERILRSFPQKHRAYYRREYAKYIEKLKSRLK